MTSSSVKSGREEKSSRWLEIQQGIDARNQQIGVALLSARLAAKKSLRECAQQINTSHVRYSRIEAGATAITVAELEIIVRFLSIPAINVWPQDPANRTKPKFRIQAKPGERFYVLVEVVGLE